MNTKKQKIFGIVLGFATMLGAFVAVFGNPAPQLSVATSPSATVKPAAISATTNPTTTVAAKPPVSKPAASKPVTKPTPPSGYTLTEITTHNGATSCWSAINGNVYDLTTWVNSHPGGRMAIL